MRNLILGIILGSSVALIANEPDRIKIAESYITLLQTQLKAMQSDLAVCQAQAIQTQRPKNEDIQKMVSDLAKQAGCDIKDLNTNLVIPICNGAK